MSTRYRVLDKLGAGAGGLVFRALDLELKREVAIKVMAPGLVDNEQLRARWNREVRILSKLSHPNIVRVFEPLEVEGVPAYAMELVPGCSLAGLIEDEGAVPFERAIDLVRQAADGLASAHAAGVSHRDVKPANLMLADDGRLRVMDFGLAHDPKCTVLTAPGIGLGTPRYMPPEVLTGVNSGMPGDVYSLALVLHELVCGRSAFWAPQIEDLIGLILRGPTPTLALVPGVPRWVLDVQARATSRDVAERPTMQEYRAALDGPATKALARVETVLAAKPVSGRTRTPQKAPAPVAAAPARARDRRAPVAAVLVIAGLAAISTLFAPRAPAPRSPPLVTVEAVLPRALAVTLSRPAPPRARLRVRGAGPERVVPLTGTTLADLPPATSLELAVLSEDSSIVETQSVRTPDLVPVSNLACLPTDRDVLVDFEAPGYADLAVEVRRVSDGQLAGERRMAPGAGVFHSVFERLDPDTDYLLSARTAAGWPGLAPYPFRTRGAQHAKAIGELQGNLQDDPGVEEYVASLMATWPDVRAIPVLRRMLALKRQRTVSALRSIARAVEVLRDRDLAQDLGECLREPHEDRVRAAILRAIALARHPRAAELARPFAKETDFGVAEGVALCLASAATPAGCDAIAAIAERFPTHTNFVWPMFQCHKVQARSWFRRWLAQPGPADLMQRSGIVGLGLLHDDADVEALAARYVAPAPSPFEAVNLRDGIATVLAQLGTLAPPVEAAARALEGAHRALPDDPRPLWALARFDRPASRPLFAAALDSADVRLRCAGIAGLVRLADREHLPRLRALVADPAPEVADVAAWALARLGDSEGAPALLARARGADARGIAVWALARLRAPEASALVPELERLSASSGPAPRLLALALAAKELGWPVKLDHLLGAPGPLAEALRSRGTWELVPVVPWEPSGRTVYPGDVLSISVAGAWRMPGAPFARVNVAQRTSPDCVPLAMTAMVGDWKARLGAGPAPLLPAVAGQLGFSPFETDLVTSCTHLLAPLEGAVRITAR